MLTEITEKDSRRILSEQTVARLGCVLETGEPYIVPVNYFYREDSVYCHSREGLKVEALRRNPKACVQVDSVEDFFTWRSVIAFGEFEEITNVGERGALFREFAERFQHLTPVEAVKHNSDAAPRIVLFRIRINRITGLAEN